MPRHLRPTLFTRHLSLSRPPPRCLHHPAPRRCSSTAHAPPAPPPPPPAPRSTLARLLAGNKIFSARTTLHSAAQQAALAAGQSPGVLWIGCSDSRVPETTLCDAAPGDVFVHRNIANVVRGGGGGGGGSGDGSVAAVVEFAVVHLGVRHVVVCGHTRCGGAKAGLGDADLGPALNAWLEPLRQLRREREQELAALEGEDAKADRLAEWNVLRSLANVRAMGAVADKVAAGELELHGLIYDVPSAELRVVSGRSAPEEHL